MEVLKEAMQQMTDQRNQAFSTWGEFENNYKNLTALAKEFQKLKPLDYIDVDCNISQCRLSLLLDMMGGPHLHIQGKPGVYETYWGWEIYFNGKALYAARNEECAAQYAHAFLSAKKYWEKS